MADLGEREVADQVPGLALDRRLVFSGMVRGKTRARIVGESDGVASVFDGALE